MGWDMKAVKLQVVACAGAIADSNSARVSRLYDIAISIGRSMTLATIVDQALVLDAHDQ